MKLILILLSIEQEEKQSHVARARPVQFAFFSLHLILLFFFLLSSSCWRFAFVRWLAVAMAHLFCLECCCYLSCCCQWMTQKNIIKFLIQLFFFSAADEITLNFHYLIIVALLLLIECDDAEKDEVLRREFFELSEMEMQKFSWHSPLSWSFFSVFFMCTQLVSMGTKR